MRVAVVTPFAPHPDAPHGGGVLLGTLVRALAEQAAVTVYALRSPEDHGNVQCPGARHVVIPHRHTHELRGWSRARHRWQMLRLWRHTPLLAAKLWSPDLASTLRRAATAGEIDGALVEFAPMAQYLPFLCGTPTLFTDHEDGAPEPAAAAPLGIGRARDARLWAAFVEGLYPAASAVQALNQVDAASIQARIGQPVAVRPPAVPIPATPLRPADTPPRAVFLGHFVHPPNAVAARFVATRVWPRVRSGMPDAELHICGTRAPERLGEDLGAGVHVRGPSPVLTELLADARLLLAPVFTGGGVRIKVMTAMAHGLPVVCNALGKRGLDGAPVLVAEDEAGLAAHTLSLLRDPTAAAEQGTAGRAWLQAHADPDSVARDQLRLLAALAGQRC